MARGEGAQCITEPTHSLTAPLCEDGGQVLGDGNVLSQSMCLERRTISNTCQWLRTEEEKI